MKTSYYKMMRISGTLLCENFIFFSLATIVNVDLILKKTK